MQVRTQLKGSEEHKARVTAELETARRERQLSDEKMSREQSGLSQDLASGRTQLIAHIKRISELEQKLLDAQGELKDDNKALGIEKRKVAEEAKRVDELA